MTGDGAGSLCVFVRFTLRPEARAAFLALVRENARVSVAEEPGCRRFDVLEGDGDEVLLYELYADDAAFDAHLASAHFRFFDAATADMVTGKTIRRLRAHEHAK